MDICVGAACGGEAGAGDADTQVLPPGCDITMEPKDSPACVDDRVGLFVSPNGKDSNPGTKAAPLLTIGAAVAKSNAQQNRVYICVGTYAEHVTIDRATSLFGGFDCNDWSFVDLSQGTPRISPATPGYALDIEAVSAPVTIGEIELDVTSADDAGLSSIAAFVNASTVTFSNDKIVAAEAGNGASGVLAPFTMPTGLDGVAGSGATGGSAIAVTCPGGDKSVGGKGGDSGYSGDAGEPDLGGGAGGVGPTCTTGMGANGANAPAVANGAGATTTGVLDTSGWHPAGGAPGANGKAAQGGGGGAGFSGHGGASGGAGGCGGAGGPAGGGGGGSIAIAAFSSSVTVKACHLTASTPGNGGAGAAGQGGQAGGLAGGGIGECSGGMGGIGSSGGSGGGGAGGLSVGVLTRGGTPVIIDPSTSTVVAPAGGTKGTGGIAGTNDGVPGAAQPTLDLK